MLLISTEKRFARNIAEYFLYLFREERAVNPDVSHVEVYQRILLKVCGGDEAQAGEVQSLAESSMDPWTSPGRTHFGLRELAHYWSVHQYLAEGHPTTTVSFREVVDSIIPANY